MNRDLSIDESLFGLAAGMFFLGYFFFEVPAISAASSLLS